VSYQARSPRGRVLNIRTPAIAAFFEFVFKIERSLLSPDPNGLSAGVLKQQRQRGSIDPSNGVRQNLQQSMAIVDGRPVMQKLIRLGYVDRTATLT
jgi:hypothetical protein